MTKDEMKNRISMALKDPILQQGFEIICKNLSELEKENADLKKQIKYYQARERKSGWLRLNELTQNEFDELIDFLNNIYEEDEELYNEAEESVRKVWNRIAIAKCGVWEMMFERMYILAYLKGKDSEVEK